MKRQLRTFAGLSAEDFRHGSDASATDALKKIPGLDRLLAKILEIGLERMFYVENVASNLRVTSKMFGRLYKSLQWGAKILDVPEPEMYVTVDPVPNAWTYGHTKPFITLTSGLIDMMSDEELFFVLSGTGELRLGPERRRLRPNDVVSCPPGPDGAHQFYNDGTEPLVYLAISSVHEADVVEYPDSGKLMTTVGELRHIARKADAVPYMDGE